jgi:hypothetical protein
MHALTARRETDLRVSLFVVRRFFWEVATVGDQLVFFTKLAALAVKNVRKQAIHGLFPYRLECVWDPLCPHKL